jgi:hypothetical protein
MFGLVCAFIMMFIMFMIQGIHSSRLSDFVFENVRRPLYPIDGYFDRALPEEEEEEEEEAVAAGGSSRL